MLDEPAEPRRGRGVAMVDLAKEDLDLYGMEELEERIERLQAEIFRTRSQLDRKKQGRSAADALFKFAKD
jgi:uncharacterized small protein (DUF1192 family)